MSQIFIIGINNKLNKVFNVQLRFHILAAEKLYNSGLQTSGQVTKQPVYEWNCD